MEIIIAVSLAQVQMKVLSRMESRVTSFNKLMTYYCNLSQESAGLSNIWPKKTIEDF